MVCFLLLPHSTPQFRCRPATFNGLFLHYTNAVVQVLACTPFTSPCCGILPTAAAVYFLVPVPPPHLRPFVVLHTLTYPTHCPIYLLVVLACTRRVRRYHLLLVVALRSHFIAGLHPDVLQTFVC